MPITMSRRGVSSLCAHKPELPPVSRCPSAAEGRRPIAMRCAGRSSLILSGDIRSIHVSVCCWTFRPVVCFQPRRCSASPMRLAVSSLFRRRSGTGDRPFWRRRFAARSNVDLRAKSISRRRRHRRKHPAGLAELSVGRDRPAAQIADQHARTRSPIGGPQLSEPLLQDDADPGTPHHGCSGRRCARDGRRIRTVRLNGQPCICTSCAMSMMIYEMARWGAQPANENARTMVRNREPFPAQPGRESSY